MRAGWAEFRSHTWLWVMVLQWALFQPLVMAPFLVLGPVVAVERLGGVAAWGSILSAAGIGSVVGGLASLHFHPKKPMVAATIVTMAWALPVAALATDLPLALILCSTFVAGMGMTMFTVLWFTALQREVPPEALSRMSSYDSFGSFILLPVGFALAGPAAGLLGAPVVLLVAAGWQIASSLFVIGVPGVPPCKPLAELC